jgi:hypothetical protein
MENDNLNENIIKIKKEIIELNNLIDKQCIEINGKNEIYNNKILKYKLFMENMILEYHKICQELFINK